MVWLPSDGSWRTDYDADLAISLHSLFKQGVVARTSVSSGWKYWLTPHGVAEKARLAAMNLPPASTLESSAENDPSLRQNFGTCHEQ